MSNQNQPNEQSWRLLVLIIKEAAEAKNMRPSHIAEIVGISPSTVTRIFALEFCPKLQLFIEIAKAVGMNFFIESQDSETDYNQLMEKAMTELGRRPDNLPMN